MTTAAGCLCGADAFEACFEYHAAPAGEVRFAFSTGTAYLRHVLRCTVCGHFVSRHQMVAADLYVGDYVTSTYGDHGIRSAFDRITALDPAESDNEGRVRRINDFTARQRGSGAAGGRTVLDVGSGLCVFLHRMKAAGWECTALDPDERAVSHAREVVSVRAIHGDFRTADGVGPFDLVTFNKVLEHVDDPVAMLARAHRFLAPAGFVYVEVPDGERAQTEGPGREEFFIDHLHVFSAASLALLCARAGMTVCELGRLREPSTKFTLWAFLSHS